MIHVTRSRRSEIVLFGRGQCFSTPLAVEAGNRIMVTGRRSGEIEVSKFVANEPDQKRLVSPAVDEVIRAIVELGGTYPDVVQALQQAKAAGALSSRFEIDALPEAGRLFERQAGGGDSAGEPAASQPAVNSPVPNLYRYQGDKDSHNEPSKTDRAGSRQADSVETSEDSTEKTGSTKGFFARMFGRSEK